MKNILLSGILMCFTATSLYAGKGKIRVASDQQGAYVYVDGKKKAMTGEGFTSILLEEGDHNIKVSKAINENYEYVQSKKIFVGEDTSTKLTFKLKRKITAKGKRAEQAKRERWQRSGDIVTDTKLGLMWQDNSKVKTLKKKWKSAKKYCQNLSLRGYSDWRLPGYNELLSIVDYEKRIPSIISSFKNTIPNVYWSSDSVFSLKIKAAWGVGFKYGYTNSEAKESENFIRCVRKL